MINAAIPLNKQLYTFSYVCVTSGAAALVFSVFYTLVLIFFFKLPSTGLWTTILYFNAYEVLQLDSFLHCGIKILFSYLDWVRLISGAWGPCFYHWSGSGWMRCLCMLWQLLAFLQVSSMGGIMMIPTTHWSVLFFVV